MEGGGWRVEGVTNSGGGGGGRGTGASGKRREGGGEGRREGERGKMLFEGVFFVTERREGHKGKSDGLRKRSRKTAPNDENDENAENPRRQKERPSPLHLA